MHRSPGGDGAAACAVGAASRAAFSPAGGFRGVLGLSPPARGCRSIPQPPRESSAGLGGSGGSRAAPGAAVGSACPQLGCRMDFQTHRPRWERPTGYIQHPIAASSLPGSFSSFSAFVLPRASSPGGQRSVLSADKAGFFVQPPLLGVKVWGCFAGHPGAGGDAHPGAGRPAPSCPAGTQVAVSPQLLPISGSG